jgi:hypothetical protein
MTPLESRSPQRSMLTRHIHVDLDVLEIRRPGVDGLACAERAVLLTQVKLPAEAPREVHMLGGRPAISLPG